MLLILSMRLAATIHHYLQAFAPTNILLRRLRTRCGLKWAIPAVVPIVLAYLFSAAIATVVIADGGSGWLNLVVLTCIWNATKFAYVGVLSLFMMLGRLSRSARRLGPFGCIADAGL